MGHQSGTFYFSASLPLSKQLSFVSSAYVFSPARTLSTHTHNAVVQDNTHYRNLGSKSGTKDLA